MNEEELSLDYSEKEITEMISLLPPQIVIKVRPLQNRFGEAVMLSKKFKIPVKDALHAVIARDNNAVLVTRDKHFQELQNMITVRKPEELI